MKRDVAGGPGQRERGFALVAVIWIATLLAVVAFIFTSAVRSHVREASADLAAAEAETLAEAGVNLALMDVVNASSPNGSGRTAYVGTPIRCALPGGNSVTILVSDEAGKIDLNTGTDEVILALFVGLGLAPADARARVDAIADFRDSDEKRRPNGAESDDYVAAGSSAKPKNAPFEAVEELARVIGFDAETLRRIRPFVTVHSEQDGVDPAAASPELLELLSRGAREAASGELPGAFGAGTLPPRFLSASARRTYAITADVVTPRGARFVREAIVSRADLPSGRRRDEARSDSAAAAMGFRIWRWRRGETTAAPAPGDATDLPLC